MNTSRLVGHLHLPPWARTLIDAATGIAGSWSDDRCASMSAALAFYAAFSLAPLLVVVVAVGSVFFGVQAAEGRLYDELQSLIGHDAALAAQVMLANAWRAGQARTMGWLSLAAIAVGATATFAQLNSALNAIWHAPPPQHAVATLIRVRLVSFGLVLGTGFLLVVLLIADAAILLLTDLLLGNSGLNALVGAIQQAVSFVFLCAAFAVLLKVLPDVPVSWSEAWGGAVAGGLLFTGGKHVFAIYLARAGGTNVFGAASSLAVLMMWLFFSAAAFLLGAEVAAWLGRRHAATRGEEKAPWLLH